MIISSDDARIIPVISNAARLFRKPSKRHVTLLIFFVIPYSVDIEWYWTPTLFFIRKKS